MDNMMLILKYDISTSKYFGGFQYHYTYDTERYTSFNVWPTKREATAAAIKEIKSKLDFLETMREIKETVR